MAIEALSATGPSLHRCDGTRAELAAYQDGSHELGWTIQGGKPRVGDLLVGVVGRAARRRIVNVNLVESVHRREDSWFTTWEDKTDVHIAPTAAWGAVLDRMAPPAPRSWGVLTDGPAADFIAALCAEIRDRQDVGEPEGAGGSEVSEGAGSLRHSFGVRGSSSACLVDAQLRSCNPRSIEPGLEDSPRAMCEPSVALIALWEAN
jgi:hypothetical protein